MNAREFAAYVERAIPEYAQDKVESGQWSKASSLGLSRQGYAELLPKGLETPDNFLFTLHDRATLQEVGMLWYAVEERASERIAYVYDILVEQEHQRKGYASQAFAALGLEVASRGLSGIALHVFGHNRPARALYAKLGFRPTNISLFKKVSSAGT